MVGIFWEKMLGEIDFWREIFVWWYSFWGGKMLWIFDVFFSWGKGDFMMFFFFTKQSGKRRLKRDDPY